MPGTFAILTDVGRVRERNEDLAEANPRRGIYILADGMGGHPDGNVAARIAVDAAMKYLTAKSIPGRPRDRGQKLAKAILAANGAILSHADKASEAPGMGTTLVCAWLGRRHLHVAHVGDSRLYRIRDGKTERLTKDHTVVQALIDRGDLEPGSPEVHQLGHILTQAVGLEPVIEPSVSRYPTHAGDIYLLCSDGLSDLVPDSAIGTIVATILPDMEGATKALVDTALNAGGLDNVTVLLVVDDQKRKKAARKKSKKKAAQDDADKTHPPAPDDSAAN